MINHQQVKRLREKVARTNNMSISALQAAVDRKTARKYLQNYSSPEQRRKPHTWRTRTDPLEKVWPEAGAMLRAARNWNLQSCPSIFWRVIRKRAGRDAFAHLSAFGGALVRATEGPEKEVFFAQERQPGELLVNWIGSYAQELKVTIQRGQLLDHFCSVIVCCRISDWQ